METSSGIQNRGPFRRGALKRYISQMSQPCDEGIFDDAVGNVLREQGFTWVDEPEAVRSYYDPTKLYEALDRYGPREAPTHEWDAALESGFRMAKKVFGCPHPQLRLSTLRESAEIFAALKPSKSAGLPSMMSKAEDYVYALDREAQVRLGKKAPNPCVAYKRTQANFKTRLVWGYPLEMTIMEARFARPLITQFRRQRTTMAFAMRKHVIGSIIEYNMNPKNVGGYVYALDYSKFDSSISARLIGKAFQILETWFSKEEREAMGWEQIITYFVCTPIVMPDGNLYTGKRHGVPSGSYFTQMIDSIVNTILIGAAANTLKFDLSWRNLLVLGDDSIFNCDRKIDLFILRNFFEKYGISLNVEKSKSGALHFLGAYWVRCLPTEEPLALATKMVFPETFRQYSKEASKRHQAIRLILSYAASYTEAWKFMPVANLRQNDILWIVNSYGSGKTEWMSGSDRFLHEEQLATDGKRPSGALTYAGSQILS